ncbi:MAG: hypothetical protein ACKOTB_08315 [Planctomycetia bacterium]
MNLSRPNRRPAEASREPDGGCLLPVVFRVVLAVAQAATILLTWELWTVREYPPLLPLVPLPQVDMGGVLLLVIGVAVIIPRIGLPLEAAVLLWAMVADQSRIQPTMLSMLYLSCGTIAGSPGGLVLARSSLISLWFFSGVHKLSSAGFFTELMPWMLSSLGLASDATPSVVCGVAIGAAEIGMAIGCLLPAARRAVAVAAAVFHGTVFLVLSPAGIGWNPEVLPWNLALAVAGPALLWRWHDALPGRSWREASRVARAAAVVLLVSPVGYWFGLVDAYLAHCLYSANTPRGFVCTLFDRRSIHEICLDAGVAVPPAHRFFEPLFLGVGRHGERLEIEDPRWIARWLGLAPRRIEWDDLVPTGAAIVAPAVDPVPASEPLSR